jgi:hypothetical protein
MEGMLDTDSMYVKWGSQYAEAGRTVRDNQA